MISIFNKDKSVEKCPVSEPKLNSNNDWITSDPVLVKIPIEGNIYSNDQVIVHDEGQLKGNIYSKSCVVSGNIWGNINCSDFIELKNRAIVYGNIMAGAIEIEHGSVVNGFISIDKELRLPAFSEYSQDNVVKSSINSDSAHVMLSNAVNAKDENQLNLTANIQKSVRSSESSTSSVSQKFSAVEDSSSWW